MLSLISSHQACHQRKQWAKGISYRSQNPGRLIAKHMIFQLTWALAVQGFKNCIQHFALGLEMDRQPVKLLQQESWVLPVTRPGQQSGCSIFHLLKVPKSFHVECFSQFNGSSINSVSAKSPHIAIPQVFLTSCSLRISLFCSAIDNREFNTTLIGVLISSGTTVDEYCEVEMLVCFPPLTMC